MSSSHEQAVAQEGDAPADLLFNEHPEQVTASAPPSLWTTQAEQLPSIKTAILIKWVLDIIFPI